MTTLLRLAMVLRDYFWYAVRLP